MLKRLFVKTPSGSKPDSWEVRQTWSREIGHSPLYDEGMPDYHNPPTVGVINTITSIWQPGSCFVALTLNTDPTQRPTHYRAYMFDHALDWQNILKLPHERVCVLRVGFTRSVERSLLIEDNHEANS